MALSMRRASGILIFVAVAGLSAVEAASPVAYNTILVIVVLELLFAFSIGVICILFSFNLLRALKDSPSEVLHSMSAGELPPSRRSQSAFVAQEPQSGYNPLLMGSDSGGDLSDFHDAEDFHPAYQRQPSTESEIDVERRLSVARGSEAVPSTGGTSGVMGVISTFASYLKLW